MFKTHKGEEIGVGRGKCIAGLKEWDLGLERAGQKERRGALGLGCWLVVLVVY